MKKYLILIAAMGIVAIGWVLPIALLPFVNILPYLHTQTLEYRFLYSTLASGLLVYLCYVGASDANRKLGMALLATWRDKIGLLLGLVFMTFLGAELSANSLGTLVNIFPANSYIEQVEVVAVRISVRKHAAATLELRSSDDGKLYFLTLSKRLFNYSSFNPGDILVLKGKQNVFLGKYVDEFELQRRDH